MNKELHVFFLKSCFTLFILHDDAMVSSNKSPPSERFVPPPWIVALGGDAGGAELAPGRCGMPLLCGGG